jgi:phage/plasmid-like protein (TIGR03299 family)
MAANILQFDLGTVGFTAKLGKTWHGLPQYKMIDTAVDRVEMERCLVFPAEKVQVQTVTGITLPDQFQIVRTDKSLPLGKVISKDYEIVHNQALIELTEMLCESAPNLSVESCGTLHNGATAFVNILLQSFTVTGDSSPTSSRLLLTNGFGGMLPVSSCLHMTRVVCDNKLRMAMSQGVVNGTLSRFKHTKMVHEKMATRLIDLTKLFKENDNNMLALEQLAKSEVKTSFVEEFLDKIFPADDDSKRGKTVADNKKAEVLDILRNKGDLANLPMTKYRVLQAVTDWTSNRDTRKDNDAGSRFISSISGTADKINQKAFDLLTV